MAKSWSRGSNLPKKIISDAEKGHTQFRPAHVDGKAVQARFKKLLSEHVKFNAASEKKSGSGEEETELITILDDVLADFKDFQEQAQVQKESKTCIENEKQVCGLYTIS